MQYSDTRQATFKVILLGESGVGKTSLFQRFRARHIPSSPKSALMLDRFQFSRQFSVGPNSIPVEFELWDTANMERARSLTESYFRETAATLLVYDIADAISLKRIAFWQQELGYHVSDSTTKIFLIGNKTDLEVATYDGDHTTVSYAKDVIAKQCKDVVTVFEVSAKEDHGVERMFHAVAEHLWQNYKAEGRKGSVRKGNTGQTSTDGLSQRTSSFKVGGDTTDKQQAATNKGWGCC